MIQISPIKNSMIRLQIIEWSNKEQKDFCVGDFEVSSNNGQLKIQGFQDWKTDHRESIEVEYYLNEPKFKQNKITPFQAIYIKSSVNQKEKVGP